MSLFMTILNTPFTRDMSIYTHLNTVDRQSAVDGAEAFWTDVLIGHGYTMPATTIAVSTIVGTGASYELEYLIRLKAQIDLISDGGVQPDIAEIWQKELQAMWGEIRNGRFVTSHFFTETGSTNRQRGTIQSIRFKRS